MSDQGLKEVIKIDPNALRLTDDIKINIEGVSDKKYHKMIWNYICSRWF